MAQQMTLEMALENDADMIDIDVSLGPRSTKK
jgi:hypothetical protein